MFPDAILANGVTTLTRHSWLGRTPAALQREILGLCTVRSLARGQPVYIAGDDEADLFGVVSGHLDFLSRFSTSDASVAHIVHPGFWFGFGPLITGTPRRLTAVARTDSTLAVVPAKPLRALLKANPEWWRYMALGLTEYADIAANASSDLLIPENERRVVAVLLRLCGCRFPPRHGERPQDVPLNQAELASMSNVSRNTLGTILRSLRDRGLVHIGYGKIRPLQPEKLRALVEAG